MRELSALAPASRLVIPPALRLMRPANIVTAYADILAGYAAAGVTDPTRLIALLLATTGLYGGGVVLNDVFDADLDSVERPERPVPSGVVSVGTAAWLGVLLLAAGVASAFLCSPLSGFVAIATALSAVLYDGWGKHQNVLGPLNMGLCRGLNLLLGMTVAGALPVAHIPIALVTLCYIAGITALSRGEVRGGTRTAATISLVWLVMAGSVLAVLSRSDPQALLFAAPILILLLVRITGPFWQAYQTLDPHKIRVAIRTGILSLILLDAGLAAFYGGLWFGFMLLLLYIPAMLLAKLFAVT